MESLDSVAKIRAASRVQTPGQLSQNYALREQRGVGAVALMPGKD